MKEVRQGLWKEIPALEKAKLWHLETGMLLIYGESMAAYVAAKSWTQDIGEMRVKWRQVLSMDGVTTWEQVMVRLDVLGIPLGYRLGPALETVFRPFGKMLRVLTEAVENGTTVLCLWRLRGLAALQHHL